MNHVQLGLVAQLGHGHQLGRIAGAIRHLARVLAHVVHQFAHGFDRQGVADINVVGEGAEVGDWCQILQRVIRGPLGRQLRCVEQGTGRAKHDRVAVGCGAQQLLHGDHAIATRLVLHHHRQLELLGQRVAHHARQGVAAAASWKGHDDAHRSTAQRVGRRGRAGQDERTASQAGAHQAQKLAARRMGVLHVYVSVAIKRVKAKRVRGYQRRGAAQAVRRSMRWRAAWY